MEKEKEQARIAKEKKKAGFGAKKQTEPIAEAEETNKEEKEEERGWGGPEEQEEAPTVESILRQLFDLVDEDASGSLTANEIVNAVRRDEKGIAGLLQQMPDLSKFANPHLMRGVFDSLGRTAATASLSFEDFEQHMRGAIVAAERSRAAEGGFGEGARRGDAIFDSLFRMRL